MLFYQVRPACVCVALPVSAGEAFALSKKTLKRVGHEKRHCANQTLQSGLQVFMVCRGDTLTEKTSSNSQGLCRWQSHKHQLCWCMAGSLRVESRTIAVSRSVLDCWISTEGSRFLG